MARQEYEYTPLGSPDHIRLFSINSVSGDDIYGELAHFSRSDDAEPPPAYLALSYCWGDANVKHDIQISGKTFAVNSSLYTALKAIYKYLERVDESITPVWIDAICINQSDIPEKSAQVRRMDQIYQNAKRVLVWLGEEADQSGMIMNAIEWTSLQALMAHMNAFPDAFKALDPQSVYQYCKEKQRSLINILGERYNVTAESIIALGNLLMDLLKPNRTHEETRQRRSQDHLQALFGLDDPFWDALLRLLVRPWFKRIWTYQEIRLARQAAVLCGDQHVDWYSLLHVRRLLYHPSCMGTIYSTSLIERICDELNFRPFNDLDMDLKMFRGPQTLQGLLLNILGNKTNDPKDYIYGLHSLLGDDAKPKLAVDYSLSTSVVYTDAIKLACNAEDSSLFFSGLLKIYAHIPKAPHLGLPSWCPDFSDKTLYRAWMPTLEFETDPPQHHPVVMIESGGIANVGGVKLTTIKSACSVACPNSAVPEDRELRGDFVVNTVLSERALQWLREIKDLFDYGQHEQWDVFEQRFTDILFRAGDTAVNGWRQDLDLILHIIVQCRNHGIRNVDKAMLCPGYSGETLRRALSLAMRSFIQQSDKYCFITDAGDIGWSPFRVAAGQHVCYLAAGLVLHVLSEDCTEHITCAKVEGPTVDALPGLLKDEKSWVRFQLR